MKVALIQRVCDAKPQHNLDALVTAIEDAARQRAQLVLLPELHNSHYFCQTENTAHFDLAEPIPGPTTDRLSGAARTNGVVIVASIFEQRAKGLYHNTAVVIDSDGTIAGSYRKMHIPDDPGFHEKFYFSPGDLGFTPIQTRLGKLGVLVCWDQWYPEAARLMALHGADVLLYPTAIGWDPRDDAQEQQRQHDSWLTIQRSHAIANGLPLLCCNRTGLETAPGQAGIRFWGGSFVCGAQGEILAQAPQDQETILTAEIDLKRTETVRRIWPFLRDRRIDAYQDLLKRYGK